MSSPPPAGLEGSIILLGILVLVLVRRVYLQTQGARYSAARLFGFGALALALFGLLATTTVTVALARWGDWAWTLVPAYAAVGVLAAAVVLPYARRSVRFEQRADGGTYYRLPWLVPVVYLILFVARFGAEGYLFGFSSFASPPQGASLPTGTIEALVALDVLYSASVGLLFGRGIGVVQAYRTAQPVPA